MRITFLCSDEQHPVNNHLKRWMQRANGRHDISLVHKKRDLPGGDVLFLVSCSEIVSARERAGYRASLVIHASDLPYGRGWSPHIWQIIQGAKEITLSLLEAEDKVDSGRIWNQIKFYVPNHALWDEINERLFDAEIALVDFAVNEFEVITPRNQDPAVVPTYYPQRKPADSQIDPWQNIAVQFDHIRICDPTRFPAFFELRGHRYKIILEKIDGCPNTD